jgi:hypothetical protein
MSKVNYNEHLVNKDLQDIFNYINFKIKPPNISYDADKRGKTAPSLDLF